MSDLREVAAPPWEDDLLVAAEFHGLVSVWSLARAARWAEFDTTYDFGGRRLAVVPGERPIVVVGTWAREGVCGYDVTGERLWQDRSRTNVQIVTALDEGRIAVSYNRSTTRVLEAGTGHEVRSLRGVRRVFPLRPGLSLGMGSSDWCRLLDRSLDPLGPRIPVASAAIVSAAFGGDHVAIAEIGGPLRILDTGGRERARVNDHFRHVVHDPVTNTWVAIHEGSDGQSLLRLTHDAEVLEQRRCAYSWDVATMRGGRTLVLLSDAGMQLLNCSDWSIHTIDALQADE